MPSARGECHALQLAFLEVMSLAVGQRIVGILGLVLIVGPFLDGYDFALQFQRLMLIEQ